MRIPLTTKLAGTKHSQVFFVCFSSLKREKGSEFEVTTKVDKSYVFIYDVFDIDKQQYLLPEERRNLCKELDVSHVPLYDSSFVLNHSVAELIDLIDLIDLANGEGMNKGVKREGLVFKSCTDDFSFKVISNSYLLKRG